jgi:hypothetical protein
MAFIQFETVQLCTAALKAIRSYCEQHPNDKTLLAMFSTLERPKFGPELARWRDTSGLKDEGTSKVVEDEDISRLEDEDILKLGDEDILRQEDEGSWRLKDDHAPEVKAGFSSVSIKNKLSEVDKSAKDERDVRKVVVGEAQENKS